MHCQFAACCCWLFALDAVSTTKKQNANAPERQLFTCRVFLGVADLLIVTVMFIWHFDKTLLPLSQLCPFAVISAVPSRIQKVWTAAVPTNVSIRRSTSPSSVTAMNHTCRARSAWKLSNRVHAVLFVSDNWAACNIVGFLVYYTNANNSLSSLRGWSLASGNTTLRVCSRHWCDRRLQLGRLREWYLLGGMLLCARSMQYGRRTECLGHECHRRFGDVWLDPAIQLDVVIYVACAFTACSYRSEGFLLPNPSVQNLGYPNSSKIV